MDEKISYWGSVIFSAIALILVIANISIANSNSALQRDVADRQATINQGMSLSQLNQNLIQAMASAAFKNNNLQMRDLLASQGITLKEQASAPHAEHGEHAAPAPEPAKKK